MPFRLVRLESAREHGLIALALAALLAAVCAENARVHALEPPWIPVPDHDAVEWNPVLARTLSFGQVPVVVDWMWLRILQDVELSHVSAGQHPTLYFDLLLANDLDPAFFLVPTLGANMLSIIRDDNLGALELVLRGEHFAQADLPGLGEAFQKRFWNPPWEIPMIHAYLELFEFNNLPEAAKSFTEAARMPGSPAYLQHLTSRLSTKAGQFEVGGNLLQFMLRTATEGKTIDEASRKKIQGKIRDFQISRLLFQLNDRFAIYLAGKGRGAKLDARRFAEFLVQENAGNDRDPEGGQLKLDANGKIISTTPHANVLGLEN